MKAKKFIATIVTVVIAAAFASVLAGCSSSGTISSSSDTASLNRQYMSQANTAMSQLNTDLSSFVEAASAGDLVTMRTTADKAFQSISALKALTPPEDLKSVHSEYTAGCDDLQAALNAYIQLYADSTASSMDSSTFESRLSDIQDRYNSGIAHLQQADKAAAEM